MATCDLGALSNHDTIGDMVDRGDLVEFVFFDDFGAFEDKGDLGAWMPKVI